MVKEEKYAGIRTRHGSRHPRGRSIVILLKGRIRGMSPFANQKHHNFSGTTTSHQMFCRRAKVSWLREGASPTEQPPSRLMQWPFGVPTPNTVAGYNGGFSPLLPLQRNERKGAMHLSTSKYTSFLRSCQAEGGKKYPGQEPPIPASWAPQVPKIRYI
jgi:hypothetical protein